MFEPALERHGRYPKTFPRLLSTHSLTISHIHHQPNGSAKQLSFITQFDNGYPWISMDIHRYPWISMDIHGCPRMSMDVHGCPWMSMDIHGYPWISMDIHGYYYISLKTGKHGNISPNKYWGMFGPCHSPKMGELAAPNGGSLANMRRLLWF